MSCIDSYYTCPVCERKHRKDHMTWHHLLPSVGCQEKEEPSIYICKTCHVVIHNCYSNEELRNKHNSLKKLLESHKINRMLNLYKYRADDCVFTLKRLKKYASMKEQKNDRREKRRSKK